MECLASSDRPSLAAALVSQVPAEEGPVARELLRRTFVALIETAERGLQASAVWRCDVAAPGLIYLIDESKPDARDSDPAERVLAAAWRTGLHVEVTPLEARFSNGRRVLAIREVGAFTPSRVDERSSRPPAPCLREAS